jgi:predicted oxidoreductase
VAELPIRGVLPHSSRLGYGCMGLGGEWDTSPLTDDDRRTGFAALDAALAAGVTLFDHADIYRHGKSEQLFGEWLTERPGLRGRIVLQSKGGIRPATDSQPGHYNLDPAYIEDCVQGSLQRLGVDSLDLWLLHRPDPLWEPAAIAACFERLRAAGTVKHFGVSNMHLHQIELLTAAMDSPPRVNQLELSLAHRPWLDADICFNTGGAHDTAGTVDYCRRNNIQLQAWGALAGGRFCGRPQAGDEAAAAVVAEIAVDRQVAPEAVVLAWLLRHPAGIQPLLGTVNPDRIAACAGAANIELSREDWYRLYNTSRGEALP